MSEEVRGRVAAVNPRGLKLEGDEGWWNYTKQEWRDKPFDEARAGDDVVLGLSKDGEFVRSVAVNSGGGTQRGSQSSEPRPPPLRDIHIPRESAIKDAIEILSHDEDWLKAGIMDKQNSIRTVARNMHSLIVSGFAEPKPAAPPPPAEPEPEPEPEPTEFE